MKKEKKNRPEPFLTMTLFCQVLSIFDFDHEFLFLFYFFILFNCCHNRRLLVTENKLNKCKLHEICLRDDWQLCMLHSTQLLIYSQNWFCTPAKVEGHDNWTNNSKIVCCRILWSTHVNMKQQTFFTVKPKL